MDVTLGPNTTLYDFPQLNQTEQNLYALCDKWTYAMSTVVVLVVEGCFNQGDSVKRRFLVAGRLSGVHLRAMSDHGALIE